MLHDNFPYKIQIYANPVNLKEKLSVQLHTNVTHNQENHLVAIFEIKFFDCSQASKQTKRKSLPCRSQVVPALHAHSTNMLFDILPGTWLTHILKGLSNATHINTYCIQVHTTVTGVASHEGIEGI